MMGRNAVDDMNAFRIYMKTDILGEKSIKLKKYLNLYDDILGYTPIPYVNLVSSSGSLLCCVALDIEFSVKQPSIHLFQVRPIELGDEDSSERFTLQTSTVVPSAGFPLLHSYPCVDLDDGRGVLLIGNFIGELCLAEFEGGGVSYRVGIDDSLPSIGDAILGNTVSVSVF